MGCVICERCNRLIDLDYNVADAVVLADGISWACWNCLEEDEIDEETNSPIWEKGTKEK